MKVTTVATNAPSVLLFLDFDGVLHTDNGELLLPECIARINHIAKTCSAGIVISSSWRVFYDWRDYSQRFENRIIGITPVMHDDRPYKRYREILLWLEENGHLRTPWIAIDDIPEFFPPLAPVHAVDGENAITDRDVDIIITRIKSGDLVDNSKIENIDNEESYQEPGKHWWQRILNSK